MFLLCVNTPCIVLSYHLFYFAVMTCLFGTLSLQTVQRYLVPFYSHSLVLRTVACPQFGFSIWFSLAWMNMHLSFLMHHFKWSRPYFFPQWPVLSSLLSAWFECSPKHFTLNPLHTLPASHSDISRNALCGILVDFMRHSCMNKPERQRN